MTPRAAFQSMVHLFKGFYCDNPRRRSPELRARDQGIMDAAEYVRRRNDGAEALALEIMELLSFRLPASVGSEQPQPPPPLVVADLQEVNGGSGPHYAVLQLVDGRALVIGDDLSAIGLWQSREHFESGTEPLKSFTL